MHISPLGYLEFVQLYIIQGVVFVRVTQFEDTVQSIHTLRFQYMFSGVVKRRCWV